jgi:hypothetical protein
MLRRMKDMEGYSISATDGIIGLVKDYYFDDEAWVIRYLVVETGAWLSSRRVLISPISINQPNWSEKIIPAAITQEQVRSSPAIDTDKPVSRQHERQYLEYYRYPYYWSGIGVWGTGTYPDAMKPGDGSGWSAEQYRETQTPHDSEDPHLRSGNTVTRYGIHAIDGDIGHLQGILVDERAWAIRYLIVNTSNWWLGHEVLIAPEWIEEINWADSKVTVALTRQAIKDSPLYDSAASLDREHETRLHRHYGRDEYRRREPSHEPAIPHLGP